MKNTQLFLRVAGLTTCLALAACTSTNSRVAPSSSPSTRPANMGPLGDAPWQQGSQRMAAPSQAWNSSNYSVPTSDNKPITPGAGGSMLPGAPGGSSNQPMLPVQ
ncbi:MAG: hypothetical protein B7X06_04215 [Verrucomicrobia bacterium 21-51-4]|nr:MAG: hypothetical protein B7X06_04215 [Verrucomicrobia bacterium 21-51-4]HQU09818.1 hypothetical protein [Opitutales bacterium]